MFPLKADIFWNPKAFSGKLYRRQVAKARQLKRWDRIRGRPGRMATPVARFFGNPQKVPKVFSCEKKKCSRMHQYMYLKVFFECTRFRMHQCVRHFRLEAVTGSSSKHGKTILMIPGSWPVSIPPFVEFPVETPKYRLKEVVEWWPFLVPFCQSVANITLGLDGLGI